MDIKTAMHTPAEWVEADTPVADVAKLMKDKDIGAIPVGKKDKLVGMITDRDLTLRILAEGRDPAKTTAADVMTPGVVWCSSSQTIEDAIHVMEEHKIRRMPVLNDKKRLVGMLALGDIAHSAPRGLSGELVHAVAEHHA